MKSIIAFLNQYLIVLALCFLNSVNSQRNVVDSTSLMFTQSIVKPSLVSSHPLGIFFSRWEGNFKSNAQKKISFNMHISSANIWSPPVVGYFPNNPNDRLYVSQFPWHAREFKVDVDTLNAKSIEVQNDGVIKGMKVHATIPVSRNSELKIGIRTFLLTKGKLPFSLLTNDEVIEFFHDNIAGGNDPFDRKLYGLNEGKIRGGFTNNVSYTISDGGNEHITMEHYSKDEGSQWSVWSVSLKSKDGNIKSRDIELFQGNSPKLSLDPLFES